MNTPKILGYGGGGMDAAVTNPNWSLQSKLRESKSTRMWILIPIAVILAFAFIACDDGSGDTKKFTVTFDSNGGSAVEPQTITDGNKADKPADPTKDNDVAGLFEGTPSYTFAGWQKDGAAYDFDTPVTANITLTAAWTAPSPISLLARDEANIIAKSVAYIDADDSGTTEYTLVLDANVDNVAQISHRKDGVTLTVTSVDATERIISKGTAESEYGNTVFAVGGNLPTDSKSAKLVIDGHITLQGKDDNVSPVVYVEYGGSLELKGDAKITGNTNTWSNITAGGGVIAQGGDEDSRATITMSGNAEISNNKVATDGWAVGGGVNLSKYADLTMSDNAAIKNNAVSGSDGDDGEIVGGGGVYIGGNSTFTVASEAVKANIKDNTATKDGNTATGVQVYKSDEGTFTVGGVAADTY